MKKFLLILSVVLSTTCPLFGQATNGFHRTAVALARSFQGITAQVIPNAKVTVTSTATGLAATIYSDPGLSSQITPAVVTADNSGNYGYYTPLNYCVTETITSPGQGTQIIPNLCNNSFLAATFQTNTVNNGSQVLLNFTNSDSVRFSNPSGGIEQAQVIESALEAGCGLGISALVGAYTDGSGIVKLPLCLGLGPSSFVVPAGASQLQLGINDNQFFDNSGSFVVSLSKNGGTATQVTVQSNVMPWNPTTNPTFPFGLNDGAAPLVALTGLTGGDVVTITYVSGTISAKPGTYPFVSAYGWITSPPGPAGFGGPSVNYCGQVQGCYPTRYMVGAIGTNQWACQPGLGDGLNVIPAGTYLQTSCLNTTGSSITLTGIKCYADIGSPTMNVTNSGGTGLLTGAVTCSSSYAAGTQSATTTLANGDYLKFTFIAAGTARQSSWAVQGIY